MPKINFRQRISADDLNHLRVYLQRKCYAEMSLCCEDGNPDRVTNAAFGKSGLNHLSVNLLGGLFKIGDELWYQDVDKEDTWNEGNVNLSELTSKYRKDPVEASVYFSFTEAHNLRWTFPRTIENKDQYEKYKAAITDGMTSKFQGKGSFELNCRATCSHAPNILNYWHFEVVGKIESQPAEEIYDKNKPQKRATHLMIEALRPFSSLTPPSDCITIPENVYIATS